MKCPFCGSNDDRVLDTRIQKEGEVIRRRRECSGCNSRFTTSEIVLRSDLDVVKKDGRREPFQKEKLVSGIRAACQKRPVSLVQIEQIIDRIGKWILSEFEKEVLSDVIGLKVMEELKQLDDVAYVRFASVYRTFKDVQEFVQTLEHQVEPPTTP